MSVVLRHQFEHSSLDGNVLWSGRKVSESNNDVQRQSRGRISRAQTDRRTTIPANTAEAYNADKHCCSANVSSELQQALLRHAAQRPIDRKSTRLNSSHLGIS